MIDISHDMNQNKTSNSTLPFDETVLTAVQVDSQMVSVLSLRNIQ